MCHEHRPGRFPPVIAFAQSLEHCRGDPLATQRVVVADVRHSVTVVIGIEIVADFVPVAIQPLARVARERIDRIVVPVPVGIAVGEVADSIGISIQPFAGVERGGIDDIRRPVPVIVRVEVVHDPVAVGIVGIGIASHRSAHSYGFAIHEPVERLVGADGTPCAMAPRRFQIGPRLQSERVLVVVIHALGFRMEEILGRGLNEDPEALAQSGGRGSRPVDGRRPLDTGALAIIRPETAAPRVESTPVDCAVFFEKVGQEARP